MPGKEEKETFDYCPLQAKGCDRINQVTVAMNGAKDEIEQQGKTIARIDQKITGMSEDLLEIKGYLMGDGREGLCDRVTRIEGKSKFSMWFSLLIIGGIITALIIVGLAQLVGK